MGEEAVDLRADVEAGEPEATPEVVEDPWTSEEAAEASTMGWNDNRDRVPEGKKFVGPVEYMERNPLFKKLKSMESTLSSVMAHNSKVNASNLAKQKQEYEGTITSLKAEKVKALDEGEHQRVVEIDEEIRTTEKPVEDKPEDHPAFNGWLDDNKWFKNDRSLRMKANEIGEKFAQEGLEGMELFGAVSDYIKQEYPDKFRNTNRDKPSAVEGGSNRGGSKKTSSKKDLTAEENTVFANWKRNGIFADKEAEQQYINEVIENR